jgi:hypothetical protein
VERRVTLEEGKVGPRCQGHCGRQAYKRLGNYLGF